MNDDVGTVGAATTTAGAGAAQADTTAAQSDPVQKSLKDRVLSALWNAMELRIVTVVSPIQIQNFDARGEPLQVTLTATPEAGQKALFTSINLVTGDVRCALSPEYEGTGNSGMGAFHSEQVKLGREIVAGNLKLLGDLAEKFADLFDRSPE